MDARAALTLPCDGCLVLSVPGVVQAEGQSIGVDLRRPFRDTHA